MSESAVGRDGRGASGWDALRLDESFLRAVLDNLPIGIAVNSVDPAVKFEYINDNFAKLYRTTKEKLTDPDAFWTVVYEDPAFREELRRRVLADCASGDPERMKWADIPITRKGRETTFVTARNIPIPGKSLMISTVWDVTEQTRAKRDVQRSETRYRRLFEAAKDGILILDAETGKIVDVNPFLVELLGYSSEEFLGKYLWEIGLLRDVAGSRQSFAELQAKEYIRYEDLPLETRSGRKINVEFVSNVYRVDHQKVIQCNIRDITERRRAQLALADEAIRRRILIEQSRDGIVVLDQEGRVVEANRQYAEMLGYTPEEVLKLHVWDWEAQVARERLLEMLRTVDAAGDHFETRHRRKDGTVYDVEISTNGAEIGGRKLVFCVCRDISERKLLEGQMKKQIAELRQWYAVTLDREERNTELKREVDALRKRLDEKPKYGFG